MPTTYTANPSSVMPGLVVGAPIDHLPWVLFCASGPGRRWCGWRRVAHTQRQFVEVAAEKRKHEETCEGGLIIALD